MFRYLITVIVLFTLSISLGETSDWTPVPATMMTNVAFDLQAHPLEIKVKPNGMFVVFFEGDQGSEAGGLSLDLSNNEFRVLNCNKLKAATTTFCKKPENIWRITKVGSTGIEVTCNGNAMINLEFSNANCYEDSSWADKWKTPTTEIKFGFSSAIAYRPAPVDKKDDDKKQLSGANRDRDSFGCLATVFIAGRATLWGF
jgi:hypothetical protein